MTSTLSRAQNGELAREVESRYKFRRLLHHTDVYLTHGCKSPYHKRRSRTHKGERGNWQTHAPATVVYARAFSTTDLEQVDFHVSAAASSVG